MQKKRELGTLQIAANRSEKKKKKEIKRLAW